MLLLIFAAELIEPATTFALTTGPTQPEVLSFEPVGTTDMVDMFSGDFVYNIPLLDVEGYPINIAYHGGVNMEQEASWVGLGWNINPGEINRSVRGMPDDFNGDTVYKQLHIKDDVTMRIGIGAGYELLGKGDPDVGGAPKIHRFNVDLGLYINSNNYRGVSADINLGVGLRLCPFISAGVNIGVGSQSGADVSYRANLHASDEISHDGGMNLGINQGYSSRSGLGSINLSVGASSPAKSYKGKENTYSGKVGDQLTGSIPIGLQNYVPVITNSSTMHSIFGRIKFGVEATFNLWYGTGNAMQSVVHYNEDGSRPGYGYLYLQNAQADHPDSYSSILDFTRDRDGMYNRSMKYLPMASMTYDVYSVSGQGTGGMFRPFRNDYGSVYDPHTESNTYSNSFGLEGGVGNVFEIGGDYTYSTTHVKSGLWGDYTRQFSKNKSGDIYENVYLRQGGELATVDSEYSRQIGGFGLVQPFGMLHLPQNKIHSSDKRDARGNLIYYFTAEEASITGVGSNPDIMDYTSTDGFSSGPEPARDTIHRIGTGDLERKKDQISEVVQIQKDGRRYIYGIPAMNNIQKDATFSVDGPGYTASGLIGYGGSDDGVNNAKGADNFYSASVTPAYAHSYLLTSVLSADYVDVTGNGVSDDDLGSYTKLNYSLKEKDYRWRAPYVSGTAQYNPGFRSDPRDDKASYMIGSREEWLLHSIETRNFVAEFYTSVRNDACGSADAVATAGRYAIAPYNSPSTHAPSYKLDSIKLFNKHERFINTSSAVPIKTVFFAYSDALCQGIPNTISGTGGKLTLEKIYFRYGSSQKSMISPYQFQYGFNPNYNSSLKDRWGNYKPESPLPNYEFPFVDQNDPDNDYYASAWSLTKIGLPSGGVIQANYESDDYAFVQDKPAAEMFIIEGLGNSPVFDSSNELYRNKKSPNLYLYFKRRIADEISNRWRGNYFDDNSLLYYNFNVKMRGDKNYYEQIKGYTEIDDIGMCSDSIHGYICVKPVDPEGGAEVRLNPVSYTAINTGRYNLPQIMYPGSEPDWDILHAISHMFGNFAELGSLFQNPTIHFLKKSAAKIARLDKSFIRLHSPGLHKKGGGQRVKSLLFYDSWSTLSGGNEQDATYGKKYSYKLDDGGGIISSGVASYEPMIGGDENPLRLPAPYLATSGSKWPPMDPVDLFQEMPLGESLYPPGSVGYSNVTVTSIHSDIGKSSQGLDVYRFYTARDFPIYANATSLMPSTDEFFNFFLQENVMAARQGFTLVMNDMHGKPKSVEHYVKALNTGTPTKISSQVYNYKTSAPKRLDNKVKCLVFDKDNDEMRVVSQQLGIDADITLDTREKDERTKTNTFNINLNVSTVVALTIPIPFSFPWHGAYHNQFRSATVTKVIQQYGILESVQTYNEGANITQTNEVYDPETGQVIITSVNNEFRQKEYTANIPAYWAYSGMAPAYENIKYESDIDRVWIDSNHIARFYFSEPGLRVGDELLFDYTDSISGTERRTTAWFMGTTYCPDCSPSRKEACVASVLPRFPLNTPGWDTGNVLKNVHFKVIRSGNRNMLNNTIENFTQLDDPIHGGVFSLGSGSRINISASTYCDSNTVVPHNYILNADTINPYAIGQRGIYRLLSDYSYVSYRSYGGIGTDGLFGGSNFYSLSFFDHCMRFPYNYMQPDVNFATDPNWKLARTITKWSPFGVEIENRDATGNYSTAVFGHNEDLPVAVATNARQGEVIAEGFEDYSMLHLLYNLMGFNYSFVRPLFGTDPLGSSTQYDLLHLNNIGALSVNADASHTGMFSLKVPFTGNGYYKVTIPVNTPPLVTSMTRYNSYYPFGTYAFTGNNEYLPFQLTPDKKFIMSFWVKEVANPADATDYTLHGSCGLHTDLGVFPLVKKTNIIDGWQQVEVAFTCSATASIWLPEIFYIDDMRIFPADANIKSFVYNPLNQKLMATLDENNFAKMFEYDQEGNLIRVKKETEKGVMTVSESRSNNPAN